MSTRLKVASWNPSEINKTALPPCHDNFQVIGVPLFDNEDRSSRKEQTNISKQMKREELIKWVFRVQDLKCIGDEAQIRFLVSHIQHNATLAKILEEITLFVALGVEGNLKCVHFYDNQFEAVETL
jgi:thymidylate synthase